MANSLNLVGAAALTVFAWDLLQAPPRARRQRLVLWSCWFAMSAALTALFLLHPRMEELVDFDATKHRDLKLFRIYHKTYLWIITAQWASGLIFAATLLCSWRSTDRDRTGGRVESASREA